jgi:diguanylate cyclase (GGDEF)-like protein
MTWMFDIRTALLLGGATSAAIGVLLFLVRTQLAPVLQPSLRWWIAGALAYAGSYLLLFLHEAGSVSPWVGVAANALAAASFCADAIALRAFNESPQRRFRLVVILALVTLFSWWFSLVRPDETLRVGWASAFYAVLLGTCARAFYRRGKEVTVVKHVTGAMFVFCTVMLSYRGAVYLFGLADYDTTTDHAMQGVVFGLGGLMPVISTVGFLLMCTDRGQQDLAAAARLDYLTGICNRRAIEDLGARAMAAARRHGMPMSLMIIDVDHFKRINDDFGHATGDLALIETVRRIRAGLRTEDLVGRLGGEEFVAVMPNTDRNAALVVAGRIREAFSGAVMALDRGSPLVTVSVGVAVLLAEDRLFSDLLLRADHAMYAAKAAGRDRVIIDAPMM